MRAATLALLGAAACSAGEASPPVIETASPPFGPLSGGVAIELRGSGFFGDGRATPNRVLIGGREAPLVAPIDDATLSVVIPPGDREGDVEVVVLNANGNSTATGVFRYSAPPTITGVTPADVLFSGTTDVTLTGTGFVDENAGAVEVVVGGVTALDVRVRSDTELVFTAPVGVPLSRPSIHVADRRGVATRERAFRYTPGARDGLLLFAPFGAWFAVYHDPVDGTTVTIPRIGFVRFTAVIADDRGDYWGLDRSGLFGRIDFAAQALEAPVSTGHVLPAMVRIDGGYVGIDRSSLRFGALDPATATFTPIGDDTVPCCGSFGLASDRTAMYFTSRATTGGIAITPIDPTTGAFGTPVPITAGFGFHVEDMRFLDGTLYATSRDGTLATIDPATGAVTVLTAGLGRFTALEVFHAE